MPNPQRVWSVIVVSVCALRLCATPAQADEVVFEQQEVLGFDWARHLLTYEVELKRGQARVDNLSLLDAEGAETPFQVSAVEAHRDGSIRRAKVSFYGAPPANGSMRYGLRRGTGKASAAIGFRIRIDPPPACVTTCIIDVEGPRQEVLRHYTKTVLIKNGRGAHEWQTALSDEGKHTVIVTETMSGQQMRVAVNLERRQE